MTTVGVMVLAATLAVMAAAFFKRRTRPLPTYGWVGLAALVAAEALMFRGIEPVATYFTAIAWTAYLAVADAAVFAICGTSRLRDAPRDFARTALLSVPLWLIFEAYNLRLANWTYVGVPDWLPARWFGYAWAFATITPAIFVTADLVESLSLWRGATSPVKFSPAATGILTALGGALLLTPVLLPRAAASYLFGLVWLGFVFLLDPINFRLGLPSLMGDLAQGKRGRLFSLLAAGWVCGWLWELWNFWAAAKWHYTFPIWQDRKIFEMPIPGYLGFPPFALECFVMYVFTAWLLGWIKPAPQQCESQTTTTVDSRNGERQAKPPMRATLCFAPLGAIAALAAAALLFPTPAHAGNPELSPAAKQGLDLLFSGQSQPALEIFLQLEKNAPDQPLPYLLEAEARWWQIYCAACEIKWNMIDAWRAARDERGDAYLTATDKATRLAEAEIAQNDTAEMELYAGMGLALRARLLALENSHRATADAAVRARAHLLRCLQLDPQMTDAYAGVGLYNYYVDTLSAFARILRVFMGIPSGRKEDGVRQLRIAMEQGELTRVEARFYLAKNLRTYDLDYTKSMEVIAPLVDEFPENPFFRLLLGDDQGKLGRREAAAASFHAVERSPATDSACGERIRSIVTQALAKLAGKAG